jgi:hypothetical protein
LELDSLAETWRKLNSELQQMDIEAESPKRIKLIQPAVPVGE